MKTRSTSGGLVLRGSHIICHWARTQQLIALSSAEAELNASVKAAQEGLGIAHLEEELGRKLVVQLYGDSSANHGIIARQGSGKVKHLSVRQLWLQQQSELGACKHYKIPRLENFADMMTHHWSRADADNHLQKLQCRRSTLGGVKKDLQALYRREQADGALLPRGGVKVQPCESHLQQVYSARNLQVFKRA